MFNDVVMHLALFDFRVAFVAADGAGENRKFFHLVLDRPASEFLSDSFLDLACNLGIDLDFNVAMAHPIFDMESPIFFLAGRFGLHLGLFLFSF